MKTINFNTHRLYTATGQRITATIHDDNVVTFYDHDRKIDGEYANSTNFGIDEVLQAYDSLQYRGTFRSRRDSLIGVNSKYEGYSMTYEHAMQIEDKGT